MARWLARDYPGTRRRIELHGARIFFPEERAAEFNQDLRAHWSANGGIVRDRRALAEFHEPGQNLVRSARAFSV
jgi:hypothetical protein